MASTTIDTETELSAVNAILGAIGQSPVTSLVFENPEISFIYNLLRDANVDVQNEGWHFNTEKHVKYTPDATTKRIEIGSDILKIDVPDGWRTRTYDVIKKTDSTNNVTYLYDKYDHTDEWDDEIDLDVVKLFKYVDIPEPFKRYIIYKAATRAATQLVGNPQLARLLGNQELLARSTCLEYECNQGNYTMFGFPEDSIHRTYQPWTTLRR